ncbi:lactococcin 972 family bacteriocin [Streptomyces sp. NPDC005251]|uniref:lactococcin 972 family bacteriocin n=1 Tax=unclassified Streptomyces TaxID=2593676 RepID=UPI00339E7851
MNTTARTTVSGRAGAVKRPSLDHHSALIEDPSEAPDSGERRRGNVKEFGKLILFGISGAALAVSSFATPAAAYGPQGGTGTGDTVVEAGDGLIPGQPITHKRGDGVNPPAELGDPSEWGVVKLEINESAAQLRGNTCENVTHGKWCYGDDLVSDGKKCYSNYIADVKHKTTVRVRNIDHSSGWVAKGETSYANTINGAAYTCYAYYSNA